MNTEDDATEAKRKLDLAAAFHTFVQNADDGDNCI